MLHTAIVYASPSSLLDWKAIKGKQDIPPNLTNFLTNFLMPLDFSRSMLVLVVCNHGLFASFVAFGIEESEMSQIESSFGKFIASSAELTPNPVPEIVF